MIVALCDCAWSHLRACEGFIWGHAGGCCGPWENSSGEQVNVSHRLFSVSVVHFLVHVSHFPIELKPKHCRARTCFKISQKVWDFCLKKDQISPLGHIQTHLYQSMNCQKALVFWLLGSEKTWLHLRGRMSQQRANMESWEWELVCTHVFFLQTIIWSAAAPPPATSPKGLSFPVLETVQKGNERKENDCFSGRRWPIVNAACSFSWPVTCFVLLFSGGEGRQLGDLQGADGQLGQFGEKEECKSMREEDERGEKKGECEVGGSRRGQARWRSSMLFIHKFVPAAAACQLWDVNET